MIFSLQGSAAQPLHTDPLDEKYFLGRGVAPDSLNQVSLNVIEDLRLPGTLIWVMQTHVAAMLHSISVAVLTALLTSFLSRHLDRPILFESTCKLLKESDLTEG